MGRESVGVGDRIQAGAAMTTTLQPVHKQPLTVECQKITVRSIGTPDIQLAADLLAPLFIKIHERNQAKRPALRVVPAVK
jgi:hypothetical protein